VAASLNQSARLWPHVQVFTLHQNMRVAQLQLQGDEASAHRQQDFADYLKRIGDGTETVYPTIGEDFIRIRDDMCCTGGANSTLEHLIQDVYGGLSVLHDFVSRSDFIVERAILTPLNADVDMLNNKIMSMFSFTNSDGTAADTKVYNSFDTVHDEDQQVMYPPEFLHSLNFAGMPPHELHLTVGCPIVLLRNMSNGLANGTRMIVTGLRDRVIEPGWLQALKRVVPH
jgi:ATP-dependent DNA helicase PIF1